MDASSTCVDARLAAERASRLRETGGSHDRRHMCRRRGLHGELLATTPARVAVRAGGLDDCARRRKSGRN